MCSRSWSGLGYYRRARMLHKAAQSRVTRIRRANFPRRLTELRNCRGSARYTAAAIASIAYGEPYCRGGRQRGTGVEPLGGGNRTIPGDEAAVRRKVEDLPRAGRSADRPGDFNQAMMELGATVCTPRNPQCLVCPWARVTARRSASTRRRRARETSREIGFALVVRDGEAGTEVLLEQALRRTP